MFKVLGISALLSAVGGLIVGYIGTTLVLSFLSVMGLAFVGAFVIIFGYTVPALNSLKPTIGGDNKAA